MNRLTRKWRRREFWTLLIIGMVAWPLESLFAMWGCDLLEHEGFNVPTPGYVSCFVVSLGLGFIYGAVTLERRMVDRQKAL